MPYAIILVITPHPQKEKMKERIKLLYALECENGTKYWLQVHGLENLAKNKKEEKNPINI